MKDELKRLIDSLDPVEADASGVSVQGFCKVLLLEAETHAARGPLGNDNIERGRIAALEAKVERLAQHIRDREIVAAAVRNNIRMIDVALHGDGASTTGQALACDLIGPARMMRERMKELEQLVKDYEESAADTRRNIRAIDVAMHGEDDAAEQASACDLIGPAREMRDRLTRADATLLKLWNLSMGSAWKGAFFEGHKRALIAARGSHRGLMMNATKLTELVCPHLTMAGRDRVSRLILSGQKEISVLYAEVADWEKMSRVWFDNENGMDIADGEESFILIRLEENNG